MLCGTAATSICVFTIIGVPSALACTLSSLRQREEVTLAFGASVAVAAFQTILEFRRFAFFTVSRAIFLGFQIKGFCTSQCPLVIAAKTVGVILTIIALVVDKAHTIGTFLTRSAIALYTIRIMLLKTAQTSILHQILFYLKCFQKEVVFTEVALVELRAFFTVF